MLFTKGKTVEVMALHFSNPKPSAYRIAEFGTEKKLKRSIKDIDNDDCPPLKSMRSEMLVEPNGLSYYNIKKDVTDTIEYLITNIVEHEELKTVKPVKTKRQSEILGEFVTNDVKHGDLLYKNHESNPTCCCICSLEVAQSEKIQCGRCPNIFHLQCSGYGKIILADYDCPHCSMKEVVNFYFSFIVYLLSVVSNGIGFRFFDYLKTLFLWILAC